MRVRFALGMQHDWYRSKPSRVGSRRLTSVVAQVSARVHNFADILAELLVVIVECFNGIVPENYFASIIVHGGFFNGYGGRSRFDFRPENIQVVYS